MPIVLLTSSVTHPRGNDLVKAEACIRLAKLDLFVISGIFWVNGLLNRLHTIFIIFRYCDITERFSHGDQYGQCCTTLNYMIKNQYQLYQITKY